ncbi:MAG: GMP synthase (glutamine-hydrolyzing), partial [Armatimonadota bacterium]
RIVPWNSAGLEAEWGSAKGVILSGGPRSVTEQDSPAVSRRLLESGKPLLGICYGQQLLASALGGVVQPGAAREYGEQLVQAVEGASLLKGEFVAWMSHGDTVVEPPPGFCVAAVTEGAAIAAVEDTERKLFGVQFHPEVSHTEGGKEILRRFLYDVAGFSGDWTTANFIEESTEQIREQVGAGRVLCA